MSALSPSAAGAAADVVIVGGGIMGSSAAFFLRQRGRSVILLESGLIGQQASGTNFGNVRRQGRPLAQLALANRASAVWRKSRELLGEDVEYLQAGHMRVCLRDRPEIAAAFEKYAADAKPLGLDLDLLSGNELRSRFPFLGPEVLVGSLSAMDGHANPRLAAPAFARAAWRAGAAVHENCAVAHIEKVGVDFRVLSEGGAEFRAPVVLLTAGAWSPAFSRLFGVETPFATIGPTMSVTEPVPYAIHPSIGMVSPLEEESIYFRQIPRGNVIIGGSFRGAAFTDQRRAQVQPRNTLSQLRQIRRLVPALARLNIIRVWSGVEGYLPDYQPVMGASPAVSGLFFAYGFSGAGFQLGPGVGETMAELIATGSTPIDLSQYRPDRFTAPAPPA